MLPRMKINQVASPEVAKTPTSRPESNVAGNQTLVPESPVITRMLRSCVRIQIDPPDLSDFWTSELQGVTRPAPGNR